MMTGSYHRQTSLRSTSQHESGCEAALTRTVGGDMAGHYWRGLFHVEIKISSRDAIIFCFFAAERRQLRFP